MPQGKSAVIRSWADVWRENGQVALGRPILQNVRARRTGMRTRQDCVQRTTSQVFTRGPHGNLLQVKSDAGEFQVEVVLHQ